MFSKIAINNVKRSFKNYAIYFLTLTLAVCIFYSFNSLEEQNVMLEMNKDKDFILNLNYFAAGTSVFVSFVLGWLIIYANNFLIKKRKKELGIYMTLGMPKSQISKILILETLLIGALSLIVGIALGIIVSQGMSAITANILSADLKKYQFIISMNAMIKTAVYFGIIFSLVMVFNQFTITKYKLIDLLYAAKRNEEVKVKNAFGSALLFLLSVALLIISYKMFLEKGLAVGRTELAVIGVVGIMGTLLFFFSLSNFLIQMVQKSKRIYFKNINIFILRQVNNKVNTNFLSMTVISLLLFLTITFLFTAFTMKELIDKNAAEEHSFDASGFLYADYEAGNPDENSIEGFLETIDFHFENDERYSFYSEYSLDVPIEELLSPYLSEQEQIDLIGGLELSAVTISDYNSIVELKGQKPIQLEENEVLLVSEFDQMEKVVAEYQKNGKPLTIAGKTYTIKNESLIKENIKAYTGGFDFVYLIVPDTFEGNLKLEMTGFNVVYEEELFEKSEEKFSALFTDISEEKYKNLSSASVRGITWSQLQDRYNAGPAIVVFLGLFLGLVFIISSAAVIALQQLSDASDSLERYQSLRKIGVSEKLINQAIWKQSLIYFLLPLSLAASHTVVGITAMSKTLSIDYQSIITGALLVAIIYGSYFYATYLGVKNIVKHSK